MKGEDFRGELIIAADLSHSDMRREDYIGTNLRNADLRGAKLKEALFLT